MYAAYQVQHREDSVCSKNRENIKNVDESLVCVGETLLWLLSVYFTCCDVSVCNFTPVNDYASVVLM